MTDERMAGGEQDPQGAQGADGSERLEGSERPERPWLVERQSGPLEPCCELPVTGVRRDPRGGGVGFSGLGASGPRSDGAGYGASGPGQGAVGAGRISAESDEELMERRLRELIHQSVTEVQPDPAALLRIRQAVPRRRARHRNVWTGTVAAALLVAAAVPTIKGVQHFDLSDGPTTGRTLADTDGRSPASPSEDSKAGRSHRPSPTGSADRPGSAAPGVEASSEAASPTPGADGSPAGTVPLPDCVRADLGAGSSYLAAADANGKVYGWFTVLNTSGRSCALTGPGTVTVSSVEGGDPAKVKVVDHLAGDPAVGLPDPAPASGPLVLPPKAGYQVRFGWVPDKPCPNTGGGSSPAAPAPQTAAAAAPAADASPGAPSSPGTGPSPSSSPPPSTPASITLEHTPQSGGPAAATAQVSGACAGTVYHSAPEAVPAATPALPSGTPTTVASGQ